MKNLYYTKYVVVINFIICPFIWCANVIPISKICGHLVENGTSYINNNIISNNNEFGLYGVSATKIENNSIIENNGDNGFVAYFSSGLISNNKTGIIENNGNTGFFGKSCSNMTNYGIIKNSGIGGFYLDSKSKGKNFGTIENNGLNGAYAFKSYFINELNGVIKNSKSGGIVLINHSMGKNFGLIKNNSQYGVVNDNTSTFTNEKSGIINNSSDYGLYCNLNSKAINNGIIKNQGNIGSYIDGSTFINSGIIANSKNNGVIITNKGRFINSGVVKNNGNIGVFCKDGGLFLNKTNGFISNKKNIGLYINTIQNNEISSAKNNGTINNQGDFGVIINNGYFINNGIINNQGDISILMNGNYSKLYLEPKSKIFGIVQANHINNALITLQNSDHFIKKDTHIINSNGNLNFQLNNFSTINVKSGNWNISKNIKLISPNTINNKFISKILNNSNGNLIINPNINIIISSSLSKNSNAFISTGSIINNGTIIGHPNDSTYITNKKEILIPAIFTRGKNNKIGQVKIENLPIGWNGSYIYKNNNLYFKLDKFTSNPNSLLGGYKTTIEKYPLNNLPYLDTLNFRNKIYSWNKNNVNKDSNYFQLLGGYGNNNNTNPKYDSYSYGFLGNIINSYNKYIHYSLGYGYLNNKINYKNSNSSNENIDNVFISTSQTYSNKYFATLQESLTYSHHNLNRYIIDRDKNNSKELLSSNFNQFILTLGGETGYKFKINNNNNFYPYIAFNNYFIDNENYSEQGDSYALHLNNQNYSYPVLKTGFKLSHSYIGYNLVENFYYNYACNNRKHRDAYFKFNNKVIYYLQPINQNKSGIGLSLSLEKHIKKNITLDVG
ncbi:autotransporter outer membrane beta-barrel domain-containing protein, partial [uncultured Cetobacterium sp.]|uniref:autotransporter outer membrane beta-barrel domain-containing protein n=1 Tax=uncultured Cetobacterium sp. TaxID=527638 RepID=UPI00262EA542